MNRIQSVILMGLLAALPVGAMAQTFEQNLSKIADLYSNKKYQEAYKVLAPTKANNNLKDIRLYIEADILKNTNRKDEALNLYSELITKFPESPTNLQARMAQFMLLLEKAEPKDLPKLESVAANLKSVWQKGTAFYKLSDLPFLDIATRSRLAYRALLEYNAERFFYQTAASSVDLLKKIIANPLNYRFTRQEWLVIANFIITEGISSEVFKNKSNTIPLEAAFGKAVYDILYAENLNKQKKYDQSMEAFARIINNKNNSPELIAWAYQLRANINHFAGKHKEAIVDYKVAITCKYFPVDPNAITYRLMRSYFECGLDHECEQGLDYFINMGFKGSVLPVHIFEMGLKSYDANNYKRALKYFMILAKNFPGHHRADDALGYGALCAGKKTKEGKNLIQLLKKKYPNSFYIWWLSPESRKEVLKLNNKKGDKLSNATLKRIEAMNMLWGTKLSSFAKAEAVTLTEKYKANLALYKAIIDVAKKHNDYQQVNAFGERLARQISESDKPLTEMPRWGWEAMYPKAYEKWVLKYGKKFNVDQKWILSIMREESHFKEDTLSRSSAHSLMQILPSTGKWIAGKLGEKGFKKDKLWDPQLNIRYGTWYLKYLSDLFNGDLFLASAAYNGGQGNIQRKVEAGPYAKLPVLDRLDKVSLPETRDYYKKVMGSHWNYTRLYK